MYYSALGCLRPSTSCLQGDFMAIFDNIQNIVRDDMVKSIRSGSRVSIVAACFSMYAYEELKSQLESVKDFRFIFSSPTFVKEAANKEKREFYISRLDRETSLYGTEFEIHLRNRMTQKAIAKECADWIRKKATFKSNIVGEHMNGFVAVDNRKSPIVYYPFNEFTTVGLGCERGNNAYNYVIGLDGKDALQFIKTFDSLWKDKDRLQDVTEAVIQNITTAYAENSPEFIYFLTLYHVFSEFLDDISEDELPNEATGFKKSAIWNMLYGFQKDAALAIINKLERYNGCILADSVGLGKTFTALAVVKYYENRNKSVLVLCPKKLAANWNTYKGNYVNNPIAEDRLRYDVLFHTDLGRDGGESNGIDLDRLNWGNYDLVVIDESHNFRNGVGTHKNAKGNRYQRLMDKVMRAGVKTKVLMLSATPVNNRFNDLKNQLALAYEGDSTEFEDKLDTKSSIDSIFRQAQTAFNRWGKLDAANRTTDALLRTLDFDFFELLDSVTIARSRKHIQKYYNTSEIGDFPARLKPISKRPCLTDLDTAINYSEIFTLLSQLSLRIYTPTDYIFPSRIHKYIDKDQNTGGLSQQGREAGIRRLMSINLLKRLESSVHSFQLSVERIKDYIEDTIETINQFEGNGHTVLDTCDVTFESDFDVEDENVDLVTVGKKIQIDLADMDFVSWREELMADAETLSLLSIMIADITPERDSKLQDLLSMLSAKIENPLNPGNKKVLIFTAFADTANYLFDHVSRYIKQKHGLDTAVITGAIDGKTTINGVKANLNNVLTLFSPISKNKASWNAKDSSAIDILIATDCISEGQNLQDCDYLVNYDIHWNPVRIIQRFGRIDRIGSQNKYIQLVNFWPDMDLDEYINLKDRVETRMRVTVMTSTGDDDLLNPDEKGDLEYRRAQLKRLQEEVVDIEEMTDGISIVDLGLNEFRLDLTEFVKNHPDIQNKPRGLHAVVPASEEHPAGVIFVLKNRNDTVNADKQNRIHPFYMVYVSQDGDIVCNYLSPKKLLDDIRYLCRGKKKPYQKLCQLFNQETDDGRKMSELSMLLGDAVNSIMDTKEESDIDSLFRPGGTTLSAGGFSGLDDFELITFLVVK